MSEHGSQPRAARPPAGPRRLAAALALAAGIAGYVGYVSYHTILNHHSLGTAAFDLGIYENVFWNSIHGRWFESSLELPGNHLGVHTTFVLVPLFAVYRLLPSTETLLVLQTLALGLAAWPLYLFVCRVLGGRAAGLTVAAIWLTHPAVGGANFDDFHALAFLPVPYFLLAWAWRARRERTFWIALALLLSVREDAALLAAPFGVALAVGGERRRGLTVAAIGAAAWVVLQFGVIGSFDRPHDFTSYFSGAFPALSPAKLLYLVQIFAPLGFLCFAGVRGFVLTAYGLALTLLAEREPLYQLGFHYPLLLLPPAFVGLALALERRPRLRRPGIAVAALLAALTCLQYGMFYPRRHFMAGFRPVDFRYSEQERERYREVTQLAALIPPQASVTASEILVPHVARRRRVETIRYAPNRPGRRYDYYLVLRGLRVDRLERLPEVTGLVEYEPVRRGKYCDLLRRRNAR